MSDQLLGEILVTLKSIQKEMTLLRLHEDRKQHAAIAEAELKRDTAPQRPQF